MRAKLIAVNDMKTMPPGYCPGVLEMFKCEVTQNGNVFEIGKLTSFDKRVAWLYPKSHPIARKTAMLMRDEKGR